jgi:3-deoxy-D-manno-octulosonic acid (KDO) 8-phosphate synthase
LEEGMIGTTHSGQLRGARGRAQATRRSVSALRRAALAAGHGCVGGLEEEPVVGLRASPALACAALACALTAALAAAAFVVR